MAVGLCNLDLDLFVVGRFQINVSRAFVAGITLGRNGHPLIIAAIAGTIVRGDGEPVVHRSPASVRTLDTCRPRTGIAYRDLGRSARIVRQLDGIGIPFERSHIRIVGASRQTENRYEEHRLYPIFHKFHNILIRVITITGNSKADAPRRHVLTLKRYVGTTCRTNISTFFLFCKFSQSKNSIIMQIISFSNYLNSF